MRFVVGTAIMLWLTPSMIVLGLVLRCSIREFFR